MAKGDAGDPWTIEDGGGGDFSSLDGAIGDASVFNGDYIEAQGTWTAKDVDNVDWIKSVLFSAAGSSKQIGRPWDTGDTHYQLAGTGSGHLITVSADVNITDVDIESASVGISDEIFRNATPYDVICNKCQIGFGASGGDDQQDVVYWSGATAATFDFENCMFHDVGRSICDGYSASATVTINFNSCSGLDLGSYGARNDGAWVGLMASSGSSTVVVNAFNCLLSSEDLYCFSYDVVGSFTVNTDDCFTNLTAGNLVGMGTETSSDLTASATWIESPTGTGDEVGMTEIDTSPYDQSLVDDADNDAQDKHTTATGTNSGLPMPSTDIVGTSRPQGADSKYDVGAFEVAVATTVSTPSISPVGRQMRTILAM